MDRRRFFALTAGLALAPHVAKAVTRPPAIRRLSLVNAHTGETFEGSFRNDDGPVPEVMQELSTFLRDHHTGEKIAIDVTVMDFLADVMASVGATRGTVLSAYRAPETNAMLARTTFGVAENSQHLYGRALDIRPDVKLPEAMEAARAMKRGGVGWYPHSGFIHIDSGPVRNWNLDGGGFGTLLLDAQNVPLINHKGELLVEGPGRIVVGGGKPTAIFQGRRPLSVSQRHSLGRRLAKAEYLARKGG